MYIEESGEVVLDLDWIVTDLDNPRSEADMDVPDGSVAGLHRPGYGSLLTGRRQFLSHKITQIQ